MGGKRENRLHRPYGCISPAHGDFNLDDIHGKCKFASVDAPSSQLLVRGRSPHSNVLLPTCELWAIDVLVVDDDDGVEVFSPRLENVAWKRGEVGQDLGIDEP